jgi:hypothetical protein
MRLQTDTVRCRDDDTDVDRLPKVSFGLTPEIERRLFLRKSTHRQEGEGDEE